MNGQLELLQKNCYEHLFRRWREDLMEWPQEVWVSRHNRETSGWSMATQTYCHARWLFREGQMGRAELKRWWKFNRRVQMWDKKVVTVPLSETLECNATGL